MKKIRHYIFLKDILLLTLTAFGGPQAHIALFLNILVKKRAYLSEEELMELYALCQILPGPTSTQTLTAIGYKRGGTSLALLTLLVWLLPSTLALTFIAIFFSSLKEYNISLHFTRFIQPIAVGFMVYAALKIALRVIKTKTAFFLMLLSAMLSYWAGSPWLFPLILLASGGISAFKFKKQEKEEKEKIQMRWRSLFLYLGIFAFAAIFGNATNSVAILLFENFYRNGSLIFGGGQVLIPVLFTEFVEFKKYLTAEEFLSGYGVAQALPGPSFAFVAFIGALSMMKRSSLANPFLSGSIGGLISSFGVFLPGALLIFFVIKFWEQLKRYRPVRASLEGINAASSGMVVAGSLLLFQSLPFSYLNSAIVVLTFLILQFTKIPAPFLILIGLGLGIILEF